MKPWVSAVQRSGEAARAAERGREAALIPPRATSPAFRPEEVREEASLSRDRFACGQAGLGSRSLRRLPWQHLPDPIHCSPCANRP